MPFDAMVVSKPSTLSEHLTKLGITPVPMSLLQAHKKAQVRKHPPNPFITRKPYLIIPVMVVGLTLAVQAMTQSPIEIVGAMLLGVSVGLAVFTVMGVVTTILGVQLRGRAFWQERFQPSYTDCLIPEPIRGVVRAVRGEVSGIMVYGELLQGKVDLDPYILVTYQGESACLGIWEDDKIIACATMV